MMQWNIGENTMKHLKTKIADSETHDIMTDIMRSLIEKLQESKL